MTHVQNDDMAVLCRIKFMFIVSCEVVEHSQCQWWYKYKSGDKSQTIITYKKIVAKPPYRLINTFSTYDAITKTRSDR